MRAPLTAAEAIGAYLHGKDGNRAHLMASVFAESAELTMQVQSDAISFPPFTAGREAIVRLLATDFSRSWENVTTVCLCEAPFGMPARFSCPWLVVMTAKDSGDARVGGGRYDWTFEPRSGLIRALSITISQMDAIESAAAPDVLREVCALRHPWDAQAGGRVAGGGPATQSALQRCMANVLGEPV